MFIIEELQQDDEVVLGMVPEVRVSGIVSLEGLDQLTRLRNLGDTLIVVAYVFTCEIW